MGWKKWSGPLALNYSAVLSRVTALLLVLTMVGSPMLDSGVFPSQFWSSLKLWKRAKERLHIRILDTGPGSDLLEHGVDVVLQPGERDDLGLAVVLY